MSRKVKSVSFNLEDKFELEMYEHAKELPNFSSFMKRLFQNYLHGNTSKKESVHIPQMEQPVISQDNLRQFI